MSTDRQFLRAVETYLDGRAGDHTVAYLDDALARTARVQQRPWWSSPGRWLPMTLTVRLAPVYVPDRIRGLAFVALIALVLGALIAVAGMPRPLPAPFGPAGNGSFAFNQYGDIWIADADGTDARPLITGNGEDYDGWYAYDGSRLAWNRILGNQEKELWVADADGTDQIRLTDEPFSRSPWWDWSPDGREIAVISEVAGRMTLSLVPTDGSGAVRIPDVGGLAVDWAYWRPPAGRELIVRGHPDGDPDQTALYAVDAVGDFAPRRLTEVLTGADMYVEPRMAPDGSAVVFWNDEPAGISDRLETKAGPRLHYLDLVRGSDLTMRLDPYAESESRPWFAPDGRSIVFQRVTLAADGTPQGQLVVAAVDGSWAARPVGPVFTDLEHRREFGFSPDGTKILLTSTDEEVSLPSYLIDVATGDVTEGSMSNQDLIGFYASWQRVAP